MWCCIEPERVEKTTYIMEAMAQGFDAKICMGLPPDDGEPFVVWGQAWQAIEAIGNAVRENRPFLQIDNGYIRPANGTVNGYYRICVNGLSAAFILDAPPTRITCGFRPWRDKGNHLVLALPGAGFGQAIGLDMPAWITWAQREIPKRTRRSVLTRPKRSYRPLQMDLNRSWALVTHSSNVAVEAVIHGFPVFVAPTSPAAPVGVTSWEGFENPVTPHRRRWFDSLMAQQFTLDEMRSGLARDYVRLVSKDF